MRTERRDLRGGARLRRRTPQPFTLLNIPKTGTMYAARLIRNADALNDAQKFGLGRLIRRSPPALRAAVRLSWQLRIWRIPRSGYLTLRTHHEFYCRLPSALQAVPALSILREPLAWHISRYLYAASEERQFAHRFVLQDLERDTRSPEPSRREIWRAFVEKYMGGEITAQAWSGISLEAHWRFLQNSRKTERIIDKEFDVRLAEDFPLGFLGCRALMFVHRDPGRVFAMPAREAEEHFLSGRWRRDVCDVRFLRQERLREDLYAALERLGYRRQTLDAALELTPDEVNAADPRAKERAWKELEQKPRLRDEILRSERIYSQCMLPLAGDFGDE